MPKNYIQLDVPKPCHEKFEEMTPVEKGRFCGNCEKIVFDFTQMTDSEIAKAYHENNGKICGRFLKTQLNRDINLSVPSINSYRGKAAGILLSGLITAGTAIAQNNTLPTENIENQMVIQKEKTNINKKKAPNQISSEKKTIKFLVTEEGTGEALIGANIILKDTDIGTVTDIDGTAKLELNKTHFKNGEIILTISYTGFASKKIALQFENINESSFYPVGLHSSILLGSPIVVGYSKPRSQTLYNIIKRFFQNRIYKRAERRANRKENRAAKRAQKKVKRKQRNTPTKESKIITLPLAEYNVQLNNIFPNPFFNEIKLGLDAKEAGDVYISIFEITGRKVYQATQRLVSGEQIVTLNLQNIQLGNTEYILQVKDKDDQVQNRKIIRLGKKGLNEKDGSK